MLVKISRRQQQQKNDKSTNGSLFHQHPENTLIETQIGKFIAKVWGTPKALCDFDKYRRMLAEVPDERKYSTIIEKCRTGLGQ